MPTALDASSSTADAISTVVAPMQLGDMAAMGFCNWTPPGLLERVFEVMHVTYGMPWWATIVASTLTARACILPLAIRQQRHAAKMQIAHPDVSVAMAAYNEAKLSANEERVRQTTGDLLAVYKKHDVNPVGGLGPSLLQMPVLVSFFLALKSMAELPVPDMTTGGALWFTDLTVADPYFALPVLAGSSFMLMIHKNLDPGMVQQDTSMMKNILLGLGLVSVPIMATFPSALGLYWLVNNVVTVTQSTAFKAPAVRRLCGIPIVPKRTQPLVPVLPVQTKQPMGFREAIQKSMEAARLELERTEKAKEQAGKMPRVSPFKSQKQSGSQPAGDLEEQRRASM